jgi:desampylase
LEISETILDCMRAEATAAHPRECCGILLGAGQMITALVTARNVHPQPARHFEIDPHALIRAHRDARAGGAQVVGYYHSHPNGHGEPSATDRALAAHDGRVWAIVAGGSVNLWRDGENGFEPLSYVVR